jgi:aspartate-semialdehyde dehydrogenase
MSVPAERKSGRPRGLRLAVAGATGTLGRELLEALGAERFPIAELLPFATEASLGAEVECGGEEWPVSADRPRLPGLDALVLCTPASAAAELAREALRAEVPCIDGSGAFLATPEVVLGIAGLTGGAEMLAAPLLSAPPGSPLCWARLIHAAAGEEPLLAVSATLLTPAGDLGRKGITALSDQTVSLLNQSEPEGAEAFEPHLADLAFDTRPVGEDDPTASLLATVVERLQGAPVPTDCTRLRVPTFAGEGAVLRLTFGEAPDLEAMSKRLEAAPGIDLWIHGETPSTRDAAGRDEILVTPPRLVAGHSEDTHTVTLWAAADPVRVAARNLVDLLRARLVTAPAA